MRPLLCCNSNCSLSDSSIFVDSEWRFPTEKGVRLGDCFHSNLMYNIKESAWTDKNITWSTEGSKRGRNEKLTYTYFFLLFLCSHFELSWREELNCRRLVQQKEMWRWNRRIYQREDRRTLEMNPFPYSCGGGRRIIVIIDRRTIEYLKNKWEFCTCHIRQQQCAKGIAAVWNFGLYYELPYLVIIYHNIIIQYFYLTLSKEKHWNSTWEGSEFSLMRYLHWGIL